MKYDISKQTAPTMPSLGKGTECIKILLSQASKDMYEPLVPMFFPVLGAHISGAEFQHPDLIWKEICGQMANLVAENGGARANFHTVCRDFRQRAGALHAQWALRSLNVSFSVLKMTFLPLRDMLQRRERYVSCQSSLISATMRRYCVKTCWRER